MSDHEILRMYREARFPDREIGILAELNAVSRAEMREKLRQLGAVLDGPKPKRKPPEKKPEKRAYRRVDEEQARRLWEQGLSDNAIAGELGVSGNAIMYWRRRNELSANYEQGGGRAAGAKGKEKKETAMRKYKERDTEELAIEAEAAEYLREKALQEAEEEPEEPGAPELLPEPEAITARPGGGFRMEKDAMSAEAFLQTLGLLLNKQTLKGGLCLNGAPVRGIERVSVCMAGDDLQIEVQTC